MGLPQNLGRLSAALTSDASLNIGVGVTPSGSFKLEVGTTSKFTGVATFGSTLSNGTYSYTLPGATGTLALTSALSGYVPYTGATANVNLGVYDLDSGNVNINGAGSGGGALRLKQFASSEANREGYNSISTLTSGVFYFTSHIAGSTAPPNYKNFVLNPSGLTDNTLRTYTLPDATGTLALVGGAGVGTVTSVAAITLGTSGTDLSSTVANGTTTPVITLQVPTASATNRGALSSADWTTFNSKQNALTNPVTGTGTTNTLPKFTAASTIGDSLFTDNGTNGAFGGANYSGGTDVRTFNITAPFYAGLGFYTGTSQYTADIFAYQVSGNLIISADPTNTLSNSNLLFNVDGTTRLTIASTGAATFSNNVSSIGGTNAGIGAFAANNSSSQLLLGNAASTIHWSIFETLGVSGQQGSFNIFDAVASATRFTIATTGAATFSSSVTASYGGTFVIPVESPASGSVALVAKTSNGANDIFRWYDGTTQLGVFKNSGNVGIGTPSPTQKLHLYGSGANTQSILLESSIANANAYVVMKNTGKSYITGLSWDIGPNNYLIYDETAAATRLAITSGGNVLIGSSTDGGQKFQVAGNMINNVGNNVLVHRVTGATTGYNYAYWTNTSGSLLYGIEGSTAANLQTGSSAYDAVITTANATALSIGVNQVQFMRITSGRQAYISGTGNALTITSDNNSLSLALGYQGTYSGYLGGFGSALYGYSTNGGYVLLNSSSVWVAASDAKRKRNFETYSNGLSAILGLQPKLYNMDFQKDGDEKQVGLVAQEVKDFIPKAYEDNNNFIGLNYNAIIVTMVNAIKELKAEIDILKNN